MLMVMMTALNGEESEEEEEVKALISYVFGVVVSSPFIVAIAPADCADIIIIDVCMLEGQSPWTCIADSECWGRSRRRYSRLELAELAILVDSYGDKRAFWRTFCNGSRRTSRGDNIAS